MLTPENVFNFLVSLDEFDKVDVEENKNGENITLDAINHMNSGNNCLHFQIVYNNHRIVIQTYKYMNIPGKPVDVVQGKPEMEDQFLDFLDYLNEFRNDFTDQNINKLFVLYCGLWQKCSNFYHAEMDTYICEFGPYMSCIFSTKDNKWYIDVQSATLDQVQIVFDFIKAIEDICK